jgi:hypothetical protein
MDVKFNRLPSEHVIVKDASSAWKDSASASNDRYSCSCSITPTGERQALSVQAKLEIDRLLPSISYVAK